MSLSSFYRIFFALTGYSVKEYIRLHRISLAAEDIITRNTCIIDIAVKFDFESGDSFSRAFKRITGYLPSEFRRQNNKYSFERINIMDKYFEVQEKELLDRYPDIKVLKNLEPVKVAYFNYFGRNPETPYKSYRNHHFYEKLGYSRVGEEKPDPGKEFCLYIYEKKV